jgi:steroid delta-isomerase-like uncharacterized protein
MSDQNKTIARKVFEDIQSQGNLDVVDQIVASDYVGHAFPEDFYGPEGVKQFTLMLRTAFPNVQLKVEDQIAEGDKVMTRWTAQGTHQGDFMGVPATGNQIMISGVTIFRMAGGKLFEGWNHPDLLSLFQQIGAVPTPQ